MMLLRQLLWRGYGESRYAMAEETVVLDELRFRQSAKNGYGGLQLPKEQLLRWISTPVSKEMTRQE